ncbi:MAG: peptidylprolyl isomerase [Flavobacteriia bacterium]|nr:peptidylprolyl isomerase [Flavobacteriia bacterium]OJX37680.1 MAG: hypothetical protein BGO87_11475 [Flavobacteriia bacterium 40-80]
MRKIIVALSLFSSIIGFSQKDPVVLEVGNKKVTKSEFLQIYLKNNDDPKFDQKSMDDYVEIFTKFKLKVVEAEHEGYDTIPKLKRELEGYRKTLATPYLTDKTLQDDLVKQVYERLKTEVRASHILVKVAERATPEDTLKAYNRILAIKKRIEAGEDFEKVARSSDGSEDPSVAYNGGDLGYFTAFQMVYPFEEAAYRTPKGKISNIVKTRYGYHILKVTDVRPARGTIRTAHIMIALAKNASAEDIEAAKKKAYEIYTKAKNGEDFAKLAETFSDDTQSAAKGGELPPFGTGTTTRMIPVFENAAFGLKNNGDITEPIQTDFGFHIIKRLDWKPLGSFDELKKELQTKVSKDDRSKITQDSFIQKLKKEYKYKSYKAKNISWFYNNIDSSYFKNNYSYTGLTTDKPLFVLNKQAFTQKQFAEYIQKNTKYIRNGSFKDIIDQHYANWERQSILNYEQSRLDGKYPDFKLLMNEYHDGILLFEIMSDKVWNKASQDSTGLTAFFEKNKDKYVWGKRVDAFVYECISNDVANNVYGMISKNNAVSSKEIIDEVNKTSELNLKVKTNKYEIESTPFLKGHDFVKGLNKVYEYNGKYYVVFVNEILDPSAKELAECRGLVISDYQNYLETTWLSELKQKYPVKIHTEVLYNLK